MWILAIILPVVVAGSLIERHGGPGHDTAPGNARTDAEQRGFDRLYRLPNLVLIDIPVPKSASSTTTPSTSSTTKPSSFTTKSSSFTTTPTLALISSSSPKPKPSSTSPSTSTSSSTSTQHSTTTTPPPEGPYPVEAFTTTQWVETWLDSTSRTWVPKTITFRFTPSPAPRPGKGEIGMGTLTGQVGRTKTVVVGAAATRAVGWREIVGVGVGVMGIGLGV